MRLPCIIKQLFWPYEIFSVPLQKRNTYDNHKKNSILLAVLIQTNIAMSQKTLIKELPTYKNDEILTEIGSRAEVLSVFRVDIERDILFSEDTLFKIELN